MPVTSMEPSNIKSLVSGRDQPAAHWVAHVSALQGNTRAEGLASSGRPPPLLMTQNLLLVDRRGSSLVGATSCSRTPPIPSSLSSAACCWRLRSCLARFDPCFLRRRILEAHKRLRLLHQAYAPAAHARLPHCSTARLPCRQPWRS